MDAAYEQAQALGSRPPRGYQPFPSFKAFSRSAVVCPPGAFLVSTNGHLLGVDTNGITVIP